MPSAASAQDVQFSFDDMSSNDVDFLFTLSASPTPDFSDSETFIVRNVLVTTIANGVGSASAQDFQFAVNAIGGGLTSFVPGTNSRISDLLGPELFTGSTAMPTFVPGSFSLTRSNGSASGTGTLTITQLVSAVPEPATWGTMLLGFGAVGYSMRRRSAPARFAHTG